MRISIIGGGNIGTLMAAEFAHKGHEVTVYTSRPKDFSKHLIVYDQEKNILLEGDLSNVTDNIEEAVLDKDLIWVTTPAHCFSKIARLITPFIKEGQYVGIVPGSGGAEFAFNEIIKKGVVLFGLQRVHSVARLEEYGHSVYALGGKSEIYIGSIPEDYSSKICDVVGELFNLPCIPLSNYLDVTFSPSNQIIHTARIYCMFKDYHRGVKYKENFLFYDDWDDEASDLLIKCGEELLALSESVPKDLKAVKSILFNFKVEPSSLTMIIKSSNEFKGIRSPMKFEDDGWVPDFESRYFTADFCYGLKVLIDFADKLNVPVPHMKKIWNWYMSFVEDKPYFQLDYSKEEMEEVYGI